MEVVSRELPGSLFAWGVGNNGIKVNNNPGTSSAVTTEQISWGGLSRPFEKLVNRFHATFVHVNSEERATSESLLHFSEHYRAHLEDILNDLESESKREEFNQHQEAEWSMLRYASSVWHLFEILFLHHNSMARDHLVTWYHQHCLEDLKLKVAEMSKLDAPDSHNDYWDTLAKLVAVGDIEKARLLLARCTIRQGTDLDVELVEVERCLESMVKFPSLEDERKETVERFRVEFDRWQQQCGEVSCEDPNVRRLLSILVGDEDVISELCTDWKERLVADVLYQIPDLKTFELAAQISLEIDDSPKQQIYSAVLDFDFASAISKIFSHLSLGWFEAHLTDLLWRKGDIVDEDVLEEGGCDLRERMFLEYVESLMNQGGNWQLATTYLSPSCCPRYGAHYLTTLVERERPSTERKAAKLIEICKAGGSPANASISRDSWRVDLGQQRNMICRVMGTRSVTLGRAASALYWYLQAGETRRVRFMSLDLVLGSVRKGSLVDVDSIADLLGPQNFADKLSFLGQYRDLYKHVQNIRATLEDSTSTLPAWRRGESIEADCIRARDLVMELLTPSRAPDHFLLILHILNIAGELIYGDGSDFPLVFNIDQTHALMDTLHSLELSHRQRQFLSSLTEIANIKEKEISWVSPKLLNLARQIHLTTNVSEGDGESTTTEIMKQEAGELLQHIYKDMDVLKLKFARNLQCAILHTQGR